MLATICLPILLLLTAPETRTWDVDGVKREAILREPGAKPEGKLPVIFDFHGHGGTARNSDRVHHLHEACPEALVVYMQGLPSPGHLNDAEGKQNGWQRRPGDQGDRDLKFFDAVLNSIKRDYPVDDRRVFATGHSNGGAFVYLLWAVRGDALAACAPVATAAGPYLARADAKPLFHAVCKEDPLVKFAMQDRTLNLAKRINGCDGPDEAWAEGCRSFPSKQGAPVVIYTYDGGHRYPAKAPELIARFFREQAQKPRS